MRQDGHASTCDSLWNSAEASFSPCAVPFLASLPLAVIVLVAIKYVLGSRHFGRCWPEWTRPFVSEETELTEEIPRTARAFRLLRRTVALAALAVVAFGAEIVLLVGSRLPYLGFILLTPAWGVLSVVLAVKRPRTAPTLLLFFYASVLLVEKPVFSAAAKLPVVGYFAHNAIVFAASLSIVIVLSMPIRDPSLSKAGISTVGKAPSDSLRSPEDDLCLWQFLTVSWMSPLISVGWKRRINEDDVWSLGFEFQHQRLHERFRQLRGSVLKRLLQANGIDIFIVCTISLVQMVCSFSTPLLLQQLLKVLSDEGSGKRVAMVYATITLIVRLLFAQTQVLNLWYGRRCYERSRGEMVMMVYEKALSRKNTFGQSVTNKAERDDSSASNGHRMNGHASTERDNKKQRSCQFLPWRKNDKKEEVAKETASMGKIFNLLRGDVYEVAQRFWDITEILDKPIGLIIAVVLVWDLFGPSCLLGVVTVVFAQVINGFITRYLLRWGRTRRIATDTRLQISSQFVESLRHLRWYGWQDHWLRQVMDARDKELRVQIITNLLEVAITFVQVLTSGIFPVVALYGYTILGGHPLSIDVIFPALQLFGMLEERLRAIPSLITVFINASIALGRIEDFMEEPNKDTRISDGEQESTSIRLESSSFAWPGKQSPVLSDVSLTISQGMTVVCGVVGAGKTALLQALLGELDKLHGISHIPNEMVGYCAQTPWLQSMSIRDNILFSSPYNEQRYKRVLEACALVPDLANFAHGDLSFVGENGIGLSGGQKARVALARAVYSSAKILFLDDPLSALDHNTAEFIVRKCLLGSLMQDRTIVLVTHRVSLVQAHADQMLEVADGKVRCIGEQELASMREAFEENMPHTENEETEDDVAAAVPDKFVEEEHRADWGVQTRVYWAYIKAGKLKWWSLLVVVIALYRSVAILQSWFLKEWGEAYSQFMVVLGLPDAVKCSNEQWSLGHNPSLINHYSFNSSSWPLDRDHISSPAEDVRPWLGIYLGFAAVQSFFMLLAQLLMLAIVFCAGQTMFKEVMQRVSHATFRFFDVTPVGRLMNRLTSDIGAVDRNISIQFQGIAFQIIVWVSSIVVIASVTPTFLIFAILLTVSFVVIFMWFLPLSQSLRRLEMVSLSPLLSNFGELLHGLTTVRAFHAEVRFQDRVIQVVDKFQGMDHFYWSLQSWLMYRFEALSSISTFLLTVLALYTNVSAGLVAFVLVAANNFVTSTHGLCRQYGQLQMDFVSVERVDELRHVELEPDGDIDPPAYWPRFGSDVVFEDVTIRYAPHLDPSLIEISTVIPGGSTAAIIGRTGSGKSTLALSLLGVLQPTQGKILIDGIDISKVNKQALRSRITFVAQDPILFPGSIRKNLDPTDDFSDGECAQALERICARHGWTLDFEIEAGGRNLSQGQRQLIGLTRAALRRSPIVILDEATASIDHETSLEIQRIVREEMRESTVITVAHRLEAINEADFYVVLDRGRIERAGRLNAANGQWIRG